MFKDPVLSILSMVTALFASLSARLLTGPPPSTGSGRLPPQAHISTVLPGAAPNSVQHSSRCTVDQLTGGKSSHALTGQGGGNLGPGRSGDACFFVTGNNPWNKASIDLGYICFYQTICSQQALVRIFLGSSSIRISLLVTFC